MTNRFAAAAVASLIGSSTALAGGLDRSGQNINVLFEDGDHVELSFGHTNPSLSGVGSGTAFGFSDVAGEYSQVALGYKRDLNDQLSFALIIDQPYGADVLYNGNPATELGGTFVDLNSRTVTGLLRYKLNERFSVHGGVRIEQIDASLILSGLAYGGLSGYSLSIDGSTGYGYTLGAAYEIPEIALRVALTYHSSISHDFTTTENIAAAGTTTSDTPQAVNLDFQTGVAADTLVFGSIRWAEFSETKLSPQGFAGATGGASLIGLEDSWSYSLGVGRRFTENFAGSVSLAYERGTNSQVSPLGPSDGVFGLTIGGSYTMGQTEISGGVRYSWVGDARPSTSGTTVAQFSDNSAISAGIKIAYKF